MKLTINPKTEHVFILGAGSSVEYGLPVWKDLPELITKRVDARYDPKSEYVKEIGLWIGSVGENKKYKTIDECMYKESRAKEFHDNGLTIENIIFEQIKYIFDSSYKRNKDGWISKLNSKIIKEVGLENKIFFINFNYDKVLDENILNFDYLSEKERKVDYYNRIYHLSGAFLKSHYPHGTLFSVKDVESSVKLIRENKTNKSHLTGYMNAVSCYESQTHSYEISEGNVVTPLKLYIMGLGGGLNLNIGRLDFKNKISEIHVTIRDNSKKDEITTFLASKFNLPKTEIKTYYDCDELIENAFKI